MIYLLIAYFIVFIVGIVIFFITNKHQNNIMKKFVYLSETLNFDYISAFEKQKKYIYAHEKYVDVFFAKKSKFYKNIKYDLNYFIQYYLSLKEEMNYLEILINEKIFNYNIFVYLNDMGNVLKMVCNIRKVAKIILSILTLGIFAMFFRKNIC